MKIAVLSGKGGTGKTFVSVNLASVAEKAVYIDCDVEEPNGRLFFRPENETEIVITSPIPSFDASKCTGCRKCIDFCRFNALIYIKDRPVVFEQICHFCGGCSFVCPTGAVSESKRRVGTVQCGTSGNVQVVTGCMDMGEASGIPVIKAALSHAVSGDILTVIDCPPGSACAVMESVRAADYCIIVAEPTAFGLHNFRMVYELAALLEKPCGVIINKADGEYTEVDKFCISCGIPVLCRIKYSKKLASLSARGQTAVLSDEDTANLFRAVLEKIKKEAHG